MGQPYVGEIRVFAGNFAPEGWALCDGSLLAISEFDTLFNLIGTTYGGDGQTTFALPNLASRVPFGDGGTEVIGQQGGVESVTLTTQQIPSHTHAAQASSQAASATSPAGNVWATWGDQPYTAPPPNTTMDQTSIGGAGGNQPHENRPPFLALTFIISLYGVYPSPN
jgi:microcystin-dependent protein